MGLKFIMANEHGMVPRRKKLPRPVEPPKLVELPDDDVLPAVLTPITQVTQTVIPLNLTNPEVQRDLLDCQAMHRRVMALYHHFNAERNINKILYRIDRNGAAWTLIVQSIHPADCTVLPADYAVAPIKQVAHIWTKLQAIPAQKQFLFALVAFPAKKVDINTKNSVRVGLDTDELQQQWLIDKIRTAGCHLVLDDSAPLSFALQAEPLVVGNRSGSGVIRFEPTRYTGTLVVDDPAVFAQMVVNGIGPEKAYGCGLMTLHGL
ncbi:MAG: type I-E CRISPR-associated protein Cas6/Cse3/CasE [Chloroflexia bacterium]|nr:type I-E CRISPR-associated protein Cas6/Cse3/CasE [Chloroflexia bacterium]